MPGQVERWLETFMCSQYAKLFDDCGFKTLQSVCQLQLSHLQSMAIHPSHRSIIYQNVEVLRQSLQGPLSYGEEGYYRNRMSQDVPSPGYESREHAQMNAMNPNFNQQMSMHGGYSNQRPMMQQFPGAGPYSQNQTSPQQQPYPAGGFKQEFPNTGFQGHSRPGNDVEPNNYFPRQQHPFSPPSGGQGSNQSNMHHSHLHRNIQNPQEVANNILHMANSSYPQYNTVQVPLSKARSAPYHVPHRSGHYGMMSPNDSQLQQQYHQIQQMQFTYPTSSPQIHPSPHSAMSPASPASSTLMSSPHSIHSGHSVPCSSPASIHSPRMSCVRSPGSDMGTGMMRTPEGAVTNMMGQQMNSPQRSQQYPMSSPVGTPHSRMVSPVPVHQQLQVSTASSLGNQFQQNYRDMSNIVSPSGSITKSHYSSCSNIQPSPGSQSVQHSNMSSPYTPGSHASPGSPNQQHYSNPRYLTDSGAHTHNNHQPLCNSQGNPLQSLQKLCMLPESRVVDPKSVVNDTCAPSPQNLDCSRTSDSNTDPNQQSSSGTMNSSGDGCIRGYGINQYVNNVTGDQSAQVTDNSVGSTNYGVSNAHCMETVNPVLSSDTCLRSADQSPSTGNCMGVSNQSVSAGNSIGSVNHRWSSDNHVESANHGVPTGNCTMSSASHTMSTDSSMGSVSGSVSSEPPVCGGILGPGASSVNDSIETSLATSHSSKNSETNNSVTVSRDDIGRHNETDCLKTDINQIVKQNDHSNDKPAENDQSKMVTESGRMKSKQNEKLLRTNHQICNTNMMEECLENQHNIKTMDTEQVKENVSIVTNTVVDTMNEVGNTADKSVKGLDDTHTDIALPSLNTNEDMEMKDIKHVDDEINDKQHIKGDCVDLSKETATPNVNGQEKRDSTLSESDEESLLPVRKDSKTYSRMIGFKTVEMNGRLRNPSIGSGSDDVVGSDIDYEDHIGCDDFLANNVSDIDEKENCERDEKENCETKEKVLDAVPGVTAKESELTIDVKSTDNPLISSPHWKKSRLNNMNSVEKTSNEGIKKYNGSHKRGRNGMKTNGSVVSLNDSVDDDIEMEVPSPIGDMNGVGIETRGGTMFLTHAHRFLQRSRKTPLNYKGTSFCQEEIMFDDDEDDCNDIEYVPKPKLAKRDNSVDFNHNTDKHNTGSKETGNRRKDVKLTNGQEDKKPIPLFKGHSQKKNNVNTKTKAFKCNISNTIQMSEHNNIVISDLENSDTEIAEKPTEGNENDMVTRKGRNKTRTSIQPKTRSTAADTSRQTTIKRKAPIDVQPKTAPHTSSMKTKINVKPQGRQKAKSLNGLQSMKETRDKTKNCNFEKQNLKEETLNKQSKRLSSSSVPDSSDSDNDSEIMLISDDEEASVPQAKVTNTKKQTYSYKDTSVPQCIISIVKKEKVTPNVNQAKSVCDGKDSDSEESRESKPIKRELDQISNKVSDESKPRSKTKSQKKRLSKDAQKSDKKFLFESDEEFHPNSGSLKSMLNKTQHLMKKSQKPKKQDNPNDFKGPMVRIEGNKEAPEKCVVINERLETAPSGKAKPLPQGVATRIQISHLPSDKSVLVPQAKTEEGNQWLCALCGKHSSYRFLGDLFGPYTVDNSLDADPSNINVKPISKKRKSDEGVHGANKASRTSRRVGSLSRDSESLQEVWVHESCSVWSDGVYLIGSKIYGLQEAISVAHQTPCTHCLEMGAMIGCLNKGCKEKYHYSCALEKDCYLDEENFSLLCPKHKVKKLKPPTPSTSSIT